MCLPGATPEPAAPTSSGSRRCASGARHLPPLLGYGARRSRRVWPSMLLALCGLSMSSVCDRLEAESVSEEWWVGGAPSPIP